MVGPGLSKSKWSKSCSAEAVNDDPITSSPPLRTPEPAISVKSNTIPDHKRGIVTSINAKDSTKLDETGTLTTMVRTRLRLLKAKRILKNNTSFDDQINKIDQVGVDDQMEKIAKDKVAASEAAAEFSAQKGAKKTVDAEREEQRRLIAERNVKCETEIIDIVAKIQALKACEETRVANHHAIMKNLNNDIKDAKIDIQNIRQIKEDRQSMIDASQDELYKLVARIESFKHELDMIEAELQELLSIVLDGHFERIQLKESDKRDAHQFNVGTTELEERISYLEQTMMSVDPHLKINDNSTAILTDLESNDSSFNNRAATVEQWSADDFAPCNTDTADISRGMIDTSPKRILDGVRTDATDLNSDEEITAPTPIELIKSATLDPASVPMSACTTIQEGTAFDGMSVQVLPATNIPEPQNSIPNIDIIRSVKIRHIPTTNTHVHLLTRLIVCGPLYKLSYTPGDSTAAVSFLKTKDCMAYLLLTKNGIPWPENPDILLKVEPGQPDTENQMLYVHLVNNDHTRHVRILNVDDSVDLLQVKALAEKEGGALERIYDSTNTKDGTRLLDFIFMTMPAAVRFFGTVKMLQEWKDSRILFRPDPCALNQIIEPIIYACAREDWER